VSDACLAWRFFQPQADGIHAEALAGGLFGSIVKHVAEMRTASGAHDLGPVRAVACVVKLLHRPRQGLVEAGPTRAGVELGIGRK
jgi:hypothetical protein